MKPSVNFTASLLKYTHTHRLLDCRLLVETMLASAIMTCNLEYYSYEEMGVAALSPRREEEEEDIAHSEPNTPIGWPETKRL